MQKPRHEKKDAMLHRCHHRSRDRLSTERRTAMLKSDRNLKAILLKIALCFGIVVGVCFSMPPAWRCGPRDSIMSSSRVHIFLYIVQQGMRVMDRRDANVW